MRHITGMGEDSLPRILHVEDDQDLVQVVHSMLNEIATLESASTLAQARKLLADRCYDLVLLDINLPDGSGLAIIEELQERGLDPPVVVFSSEDVGSDVVEQVKVVLQKTRVDNLHLLQTIQHLIGTDTERPAGGV